MITGLRTEIRVRATISVSINVSRVLQEKWLKTQTARWCQVRFTRLTDMEIVVEAENMSCTRGLIRVGLGITRYLAIRYYRDILPTITIISQYSDSAIIDILQEISSTIHPDICFTEEIHNLLLTALIKTLSINFT